MFTHVNVYVHALRKVDLENYPSGSKSSITNLFNGVRNMKHFLQYSSFDDAHLEK